MTRPSLHFSVPGIGPAGLLLPMTLAAQAQPEVKHTATRPDAAEREDSSRVPDADAGAVEFDSWVAHLRHAAR